MKSKSSRGITDVIFRGNLSKDVPDDRRTFYPRYQSPDKGVQNQSSALLMDPKAEDEFYGPIPNCRIYDNLFDPLSTRHVSCIIGYDVI